MNPGLRRVLIATRSTGKLKELSQLFAAAGFDSESLADAGVGESSEEAGLEDRETFEENAVRKAVWFAALTGRVVVADDSGLCVDALGGMPGVRSKRWSGRLDLDGAALDDANNRLLLASLDEASRRGDGRRTAHYECAAVCAFPHDLELIPAAARTGAGQFGAELGSGWGSARAGQSDGVIWFSATGTCKGEILCSPRGSGGFGYDPYFQCADLGGRTFAEASSEEKSVVSHRGRAFGALLELMRKNVFAEGSGR